MDVTQISCKYVKMASAVQNSLKWINDYVTAQSAVCSKIVSICQPSELYLNCWLYEVN